ncbi:MAG: glycosyltransferase family 2 protein [Salinivirgaceae bacterium]|nr:glycosyltransferase family 2 protein [Salinivirgaceae bacterium]
MKNEYALVSIITINYKQAEVTNQLIASLQRITWPNFELIVVDNNSGENDCSKINTTNKNTLLICNTKNDGFAGGNNIGIKAAKGDYILLLNNDTEVAPGFLEPMIELFEKNDSIGAVSPKIKFFHHPELIQYAGFTKMNPFTLRMHAIGSRQIDNGTYDEVSETHFAHGCAMMVSRKVLETVGYMPEEYFLYYEEHDWSAAIKRKGYQIWYQPESLVLHKESISVKKGSVLKTYFINRNRILFMKRNFNWINRLMAFLFILLISFPKNLLMFLIKSEYKHLQAYWDAISWNFTHKTKNRWNH